MYEHLTRNRAQGRGEASSLFGCEKAARDLEEGLMTLLEGLEGFDIPCAECLSVAGLLAIIALFPGSGRVIPEGEREVSAPEDPLLFNLLTKSVILSTHPVLCIARTDHARRCTYPGVPTTGYQGGHIAQGIPTTGTREGI